MRGSTLSDRNRAASHFVTEGSIFLYASSSHVMRLHFVLLSLILEEEQDSENLLTTSSSLITDDVHVDDNDDVGKASSTLSILSLLITFCSFTFHSGSHA